MKESSTYQEIVEEGRREGLKEGEQKGQIVEARKLLVRWGTDKFGRPSGRTHAALTKITDLDRLEALLERLETVDTWRDLLAEPPANP